MKRFFIFALVATVFAACSTDTTQDLAPEIPTSPDELYVSFDKETSRIQLGENSTPVWTEGDLVSVFYKSNANQQWQFQGKTGDSEGTLKRVNAGTATVAMEKVIAVYPYNENYLITPSSGNIEASLPAEQTYLADSFGLGSSPMISSGYYTQLSFKNVCGWLKLQFTGTGSIEKIVLRGNNREQVAGNIYICADDASCILASEMGSTEDDGIGGTGGNLLFDDAILTEVTLNCDEAGVRLNAETPEPFYIALPPQTFEKGITIDVLWTDGLTMTKSTTNSLTIERNHIVPMTSIPAQPTPPANEIWYTSSTGNIVTPYATDVFGATIVSNTYENGKGIIKFNGNVTSIGYQAFAWCSPLTSVTIPNSVTSIGERAFASCSLTSITIPDSVTSIGERAFASCSALTSVTIPNSVTSIGSYTFYHCSALKSITIPNSVTEIGVSAFYYCDALESVTIPDSVTSIGKWAFMGCTGELIVNCNIPSASKYEEGAFYGSKFTSVIIGNSVTSIGEKAFYDCEALTSVTIGNGVTSIGYDAFYHCSALESVTIPDSVTEIGETAFCKCSALESVTIPNSIISIGRYAFYYSYALTRVDITDLEAWCKISFGTAATPLIHVGNLYLNGELLENIVIPESITELKQQVFLGVECIKSVTIHNKVTSIGYNVFSGCSALENVTIGNSVTSIGDYTFFRCSALTSVTIPNSVTEIGQGAFDNCTALKEVYCKPTTPPACGESMFDGNASGRKIYVPTASIDAYKAASDWSSYKSYIEPYDFTE